MGFIRKVASVVSHRLVASRSAKEGRARKAAAATWHAQQGTVDVHRYTLLIEERLR
jgi:hypothetical protein